MHWGDTHGVSSRQRYSDFKEMLEEAALDFISISTKPELREAGRNRGRGGGHQRHSVREADGAQPGRSAPHPPRLRRKQDSFGHQSPEASPHRVAASRLHVRAGRTGDHRTHRRVVFWQPCQPRHARLGHGSAIRRGRAAALGHRPKCWLAWTMLARTPAPAIRWDSSGSRMTSQPMCKWVMKRLSCWDARTRGCACNCGCGALKVAVR